MLEAVGFSAVRPQVDKDGARKDHERKKAHLAMRDRPINPWVPGDARVAPLRCPILRLEQNHCNTQKYVNHPLTCKSVSGIGWASPTGSSPGSSMHLEIRNRDASSIGNMGHMLASTIPRRAQVTPGEFFYLKLCRAISYNPNRKRFNRSLKIKQWSFLVPMLTHVLIQR